MDGMSGSGQCRCRSGFAGTACELCAPGAFGPHCQGGLSCPTLLCSLIPLAPVPTPSSCLFLSSACRCTSHGHCDEGLGGSGSCFCDEGWTGSRCEVQLGEWPMCLCPPCMLVYTCTHQVEAVRVGGREAGGASRRAATNLDMCCGPRGTELQPVCAPPCAPEAVCRVGNSCECSLGYEGDGRTCTGEQVGGEVRWEALLPSCHLVQPLPPFPSGRSLPGWAWRLQ